MKKRIRATLAAAALVLAIALSVAACSAEPAASPTASSQTQTESVAPDVPAGLSTQPPATTPEQSPSQTPATTPEQSPSPKPAEQIELVVFAAASMRETLNEIATLYAEAAPNVKLTYNFESSGTLKTQIEEGAECDIFISAGQKQMNQLDITAPDTVNTDGLDFVLSESRTNLLENRVTLVVPSGNPKDINSFEDLAAALRGGQVLMAMGNSDVPVGQYTQQILQYFNLDEQALASSGVISYGSNVKEVTVQVKEASVDCGVIYCTDAFSDNLEIVDYATTDMCGRVIYPAAVMKSTPHPEAAATFLNYLKTPEATAVFERVGFAKVG